MEGGLSECHSKTVQRLSSLIQFYFPLQEMKTRSSTVRQKEALAMKTFIFDKNICSKDSMKMMRGFFIFLLNLPVVFSDQAIKGEFQICNFFYPILAFFFSFLNLSPLISYSA